MKQDGQKRIEAGFKKLPATRQKGGANSVYIVRVNNYLTKAIANEREPGLFDIEEIKKNGGADYSDNVKTIMKADELINEARRTRTEKENERNKTHKKPVLIERRSKPVIATPQQTKLIFALNALIDRDRDKEDVALRLEHPLVTEPAVVRMVNLTSISRMINNGSARRREVERIRDDLQELSMVQNMYYTKADDGTEVEYIATLFSMGDKIIVKNKKKGVNEAFAQITFGAMFFYEYKNHYSPENLAKIFQIWGRAEGTGTELFAIILSSVINVRPLYNKIAQQAAARIRKEGEKKGKSEEEINDEIAEAKRQAFDFQISFDKLKSRVRTRYDTKQYRVKFHKDLKKAIDALKQMELITKGSVNKKEKKLCLQIAENTNWKQLKK